jgi:hypothetical protein
MCIVCSDGHHTLFVDNDSVTSAQAAAVNLGMGKVLNFLAAYVDSFFCFADSFQHSYFQIVGVV